VKLKCLFVNRNLYQYDDQPVIVQIQPQSQFDAIAEDLSLKLAREQENNIQSQSQSDTTEDLFLLRIEDRLLSLEQQIREEKESKSKLIQELEETKTQLKETQNQLKETQNQLQVLLNIFIHGANQLQECAKLK